jgi:hypothetical protein
MPAQAGANSPGVDQPRYIPSPIRSQIAARQEGLKACLAIDQPPHPEQQPPTTQSPARVTAEPVQVRQTYLGVVKGVGRVCKEGSSRQSLQEDVNGARPAGASAGSAGVRRTDRSRSAAEPAAKKHYSIKITSAWFADARHFFIPNRTLLEHPIAVQTQGIGALI